MKAFDKNAPENKKRYQDKTYKIIPADKAMDLGFHEEKRLKNGRAESKIKSCCPSESYRYILNENDGIPAFYKKSSDITC